MKVKQLIQKLNELVEANPENAELDVRWYDEALGHTSSGDGWPIQLFRNVYSKQIYCVLNATYNPPAFGLVAVSNKHEKYNDSRTIDC